MARIQSPIVRGQMRPGAQGETVMTKIRSGVCGALVFLVSAIPTAAFAEFKPTAAQRSACMGDAMSLCSSVLMNMDRVLSCLSSKKSQLSTGCRSQFEAGKGAVAQK
jgi:hypothetical protein